MDLPAASPEKRKLEHKLDRLESHLPHRFQRCLAWLRQPANRLIRIPLGILLTAGAFLSILPIFGMWMLPLGLLLLALDVPLLRRPVNALMGWGERTWAGVRSKLWRRGGH